MGEWSCKQDGYRQLYILYSTIRYFFWLNADALVYVDKSNISTNSITCIHIHFRSVALRYTTLLHWTVCSPNQWLVSLPLRTIAVCIEWQRQYCRNTTALNYTTATQTRARFLCRSSTIHLIALLNSIYFYSAAFICGVSFRYCCITFVWIHERMGRESEMERTTAIRPSAHVFI